MILDLTPLPAGRQLRVLRHAKGWRLSDLAARTGMPEPRISEIEIGRRAPARPGELERLRAALAAEAEA